MSLKGKAWTLAKAFEGIPKVSDFQLVEEDVSTELKDGEILTEALYMTVDPYMRMVPVSPGSVLHGEQVARVKLSKNPDFPVDSLVQFHHGWRTLAVLHPDMPRIDGTYGKLMLHRVPDLGGLSPSLALGVLGMPGLTAYFGLTEEKGDPRPGQVVLVSGAAGAVGSAVGQIAKLKGAVVIGSAGSDEKCELLKSWGFDHVFNYKTTSVAEALARFAPQGVDLYFDNVGGHFLMQVLERMKNGGRVVACGSISDYNDNSQGPSAFQLYSQIIFKNLTLCGIIVWDYYQRFPEGVTQLLKWIQEGRLKYSETTTEGFDKMPEAFISLFKGTNIGKVIVKV